MRNHKAAILATVCAAVLAINLDTTIVNVALPSHLQGALGQHPPAPVGRRRLQPGVRRAGAGGRLAVGPVRPAARSDRRAGRLRARQRRGRARRLGGGAGRGAVRDGNLRRADLPDDPVDHQQHLPGPSGAGRRARRLGRGRRPRRRARPGHRRCPARALLLGQRVLGAGAAGAGDRGGDATCSCPSRGTRRCPGSTGSASWCRSRCWSRSPTRSSRRRAAGGPRSPPSGASPPRARCWSTFVLWERRTPHPMLDVTLFKDRRFSAASGAVTITFFALFGFIFLVTQYFQFVRGYGALSTGARILPVALSIALASVVGAALAPRIGTQDRGDHGDGALRRGVPVDLDGVGRHVVRPRDRAADGADGPGHGPDLHARDRVDPARAATGTRRRGQRRERRDARAGRDPRGRGRGVDLLLGVRRPPGLRLVRRPAGRCARPGPGLRGRRAGGRGPATRAC